VAFDVSDLITEDDEPVDNIFSEKQQRLLTEPLLSSWGGPSPNRPFVAFANVGLFYGVRQPLVPDVMLSLDVTLPDDIWQKSHRSYMVWEYGKPPDVVIEIVSNQYGGEDGHKFQEYARIGITYYVIFDPMEHVDRGILRAYGLYQGGYVPLQHAWFPRVGLGVELWHGTFEERDDTWLRWYDAHGVIIPTGNERAEWERTEKERALYTAEQEYERAEWERTEKEQALLTAEQERQRAEQERQRAEQLAAKLHELGVDM
jgi:Uma2 family endonuclease